MKKTRDIMDNGIRIVHIQLDETDVAEMRKRREEHQAAAPKKTPKGKKSR